MKQKITFKVDEGDLEKVKDAASRNGKTVSCYIRDLIIEPTQKSSNDAEQEVNELLKEMRKISSQISAFSEHRGPANVDDRLVNALIEIRDGIAQIQKAQGDESMFNEFKKLAGWIKKTVEEGKASGSGGDIKNIEVAIEKFTKVWVLVGQKFPALTDSMRKAGLME